MNNNTTVDKILEATARQIMKKSLSGLRLRAIAEEAGVVNSNLHYYYKTKDELLEALLEDILKKFQQMRTDLLNEKKHTFEDQMGGFFEQKKDIILNHKEYDIAEIDFWSQINHNEKIKQYFRRSYASWHSSVKQVISAYYPECPEEDLTLFSYLIVSMMEGASWQYLMDEESFDLDRYFKLCLKVILNTMEKDY